MYLINPFQFAASPPNITELYLWLDSSVSATLTADVSTGKMSSIKCRATGRVWSQDTVDRRPKLETVAAFKQQVMNFHYDGTLSKSFTAPAAASAINSGYTMIWVGDPSFTNASSYHAFALGQSTATNSIQTAQNVTLLFYSPPAGTSIQAYQPAGYDYTVSLTSTAVNVYASTVPAMGQAASGVKFYHNNTEKTSAGSSGTLGGSYNPTVLGSYDTLYRSWGRCGELLVYTRELNTTELTNVYNYLTAKWVA